MIVAVSGWKGSGKDTVAQYLIDNHGFIRIAFADVLKDIVSEQYQIPRHWLDRQDLKEKPLLQYPVEATDRFCEAIHLLLAEQFKTDPSTGKLCWTPRALAILEGSIKRSVNPDYWIQRAISKAEPGKHYVISDARYSNELNKLKETLKDQMVTVRIERFDIIDTIDPSERDLDSYLFDYKINNKISEGKSLDDVYLQVDSVILNETALDNMEAD